MVVSTDRHIVRRSNRKDMAHRNRQRLYPSDHRRGYQREVDGVVLGAEQIPTLPQRIADLDIEILSGEEGTIGGGDRYQRRAKDPAQLGRILTSQ